MVTQDIKDMRERILYIATTHGAKKIRLFGSIARGESRPESDIDLLVSFDEGRSLFDVIAFKADIEELFGRKVDVVTEDSVHWYIRDKILQEAIEI